MEDYIGNPSTHKTTTTGTLPSPFYDYKNNDKGKNCSNTRHRQNNCRKARQNNYSDIAYSTEIHYAVSFMRGRRKTQEDAAIIETNLFLRDNGANNKATSTSHSFCSCHAMFGIFDGHGTSFASNFAAENFTSIFCEQPSFLEYFRQNVNHNGGWLGNSITQETIPRTSEGNTKTATTRNETENVIHETKKFSDRSNAKEQPGSFKFSHLLETAIQQTFIELDARMLQELMSTTKQNKAETQQKNRPNFPASNNMASSSLFDDSESGTTAIIILLTPNDIICANLGDSRAMLCRSSSDGPNEKSKRNNTIISLSNDHKPCNEEEKARIEAAGGVVLGDKIEGRLAVSRALGDFDFKDIDSVLFAAGPQKNEDDNSISNIGDNTICSNEQKGEIKFIHPNDQMVSCIPEVTVIQRDKTQDQYLIIACDGIWDVLSNEGCEQVISAVFQEGERDVGLVCEELLDECFAKGSLDNLTATILRFPAQEIGVGGGVRKRRKQRLHKKAR